MDPYLDALSKEVVFVAGAFADKPLTTIYVGGGTPTALTEEGLERLMEMIHLHFQVDKLREFTVEAGRPDSVNREKFKILKNAGVSRISINPQTMHQETLDLIGRNHTVDQVREAYYMARETGFSNINMDIITGLPGEDISHIKGTLQQLRQMEPESLTVHSLAIKRAAFLNIEMERYRSLVKGSTNDMLRLVDETCRDMGMEAYYMYRQKNIPGNLENIGYSLPGKECLYNILIMEEIQDIISCGAGGSTKYVYPAENRIERTENVKNIDHYINRIDEMIEKKRSMLNQ
jgi:oxygen-independent coproporphyrinogen-3 oxidase